MATTDRVSLPGTRVTTTDRIGQTVVLGGAAFAVSFSVIATETVSFIGESEARVAFDLDATATLVMVASVILADFEFPAQATTTFTAESTASVPFNFAASGLFSWMPFLGLEMRNVIINGNFDVWQRGTSLGSGTGKRYLPDRFFTNSTGSAYVPSRQSFTLGQTDVPNEPTYFFRNVVTSVAGAGNHCNATQRVEGVRTFAGQAVVLTFWAKADASKNIAAEIAQNFGTGGSPSAVVSVQVTTCALTTSWQKFTITTTISSISGKTLGSDGNDALELNIWFDAGSSLNSRTNSLGQQNGTFDIAQVQWEAGSVASAFEKLPIELIFSLCERYYEICDSGHSYDPGADASATVIYRWIAFKTRKCANPTMTPPSSTTNMLWTSGGGDLTPSSIVTRFSGVNGASIQYSAASPISGVKSIGEGYSTTADAEL